MFILGVVGLVCHCQYHSQVIGWKDLSSHSGPIVLMMYPSVFVQMGTCLIDGNCYAPREVNSDNPSEMCNPALNATVWTARPTGEFSVFNVMYNVH